MAGLLGTNPALVAQTACSFFSYIVSPMAETA
jgi:hypothetical protein